MNRFILFPGRHHLLTRFQADYLQRFDSTVVWAVTSANHQNTKRNPIAYDRREAAIERLSAHVGLRSLVVPVFDTAPTDRFAEVTLKSIEATLGEALTPQNAIVACSATRRGANWPTRRASTCSTGTGSTTRSGRSSTTRSSARRAG